MQPPQTVHDLSYEWPPNLTQYESRIFLGLAAHEATAAGFAFLLTIGLVRSGAGVVLGAVAAVAVLLLVKRWERLGNRSLPVYLVARGLERRQETELELPLILGGHAALVEVEAWEGETLLVLEE
jgi:hypothetical protein